MFCSRAPVPVDLLQSLAKKRNHLVNRYAGRLARRVYQIACEDRMRRFSAGEKARRVAGAVRQFRSCEGVAKRAAQRCKARRLAQLIAGETIAAQLQSLSRPRHDLL